MMPTPVRILRLRHLVREQIAALIQDDIDGNELLMKEVYEECDGQGELDAVYAEMKRIVNRLRSEP